MKAMPGAPSRSAIAQIEQLSRNFERATRQRYGLRHGVNRINEMIRSINGLSDHFIGFRTALSKSIPQIRLADCVAKDLASQLPDMHRILPGTTP